MVVVGAVKPPLDETDQDGRLTWGSHGASRQALDIRPVSISFFPFASGAIDYCSTAENRETHKFRD